jgi:hypothetical protein
MCREAMERSKGGLNGNFRVILEFAVDVKGLFYVGQQMEA